MRAVYQSVTLRNKLETAKHPNPLKKDFQCAIVGSLHPVKGQDEAISAISELVRRGIDAHLLVIGDGPKRFAATLYKKVEEYELRSHVKFTGYVENPLPYIQMTDVMLMCSKWEAFPRVTIEAMLAGKPLIGSARGGIVEQIQDGETGLLYQGGNYLELADKIQYLYENHEERLRLGKAARRWAIDRFTQERYAKEVFDLLKNVLAKENCTANPPQFHKSQLNKN
jgi:glycosyltransferase involved in cell wall biosynthesis